MIVWITGLPQSGKSTLASRLADAVEVPRCVLDSDDLRTNLYPKLGYDEADRDAFYAGLGNLALLLAKQGLLVIVAATASRRAYRDSVRRCADQFIEVFVDADTETCRTRDQKGLYDGDKKSLPGLGTTYERPPAAEIVATGGHDDDALAQILASVARGV